MILLDYETWVLLLYSSVLEGSFLPRLEALAGRQNDLECALECAFSKEEESFLGGVESTTISIDPIRWLVSMAAASVCLPICFISVEPGYSVITHGPKPKQTFRPVTDISKENLLVALHI